MPPAPPLSYEWQRNGVPITGATSSSYTIASAQLADNGVGFRCRVANTYGNVTSSSATLAVTANLAPTAGITSPTAGATYAGGQTINYSGTGTDPEDGTLAQRARSSGRSSSTTAHTRTLSSHRRAAPRPVLS